MSPSNEPGARRARDAAVARCGAIALLLAASATAAQQPLSPRTVAVTGQEAPGTEPGTQFAHLFAFPFFDPPIGGDGSVVLFGRLEGPEVTQATDSGVWAELGNELALVARAGDPAPGTEEGTVFLDFSIVELPVRPTLENGRVVFQGLLFGPGVDGSNNAGLWGTTGGTPELLLRTGDAPPGAAGEPTLLELFHHGLGPGGSLFVATRTNGDPDGDEAFWSDRDGSLQPVLVEGAAVEGLPPGVVPGEEVPDPVNLFRLSSFADDDSFSVIASLRGPGVGPVNDEVVLSETGGAVVAVAREGDPVPGLPGEVFGEGGAAHFRPLVSGSSGRVAFGARIRDGGDFLGGIFSTRGGALETHVLTGDAAPGTGSTFFFLSDMEMNRSDVILFRGLTVAEPTTGGLWTLSDAGVSPFAVPGEALPGLAGAVLVGVGAVHGWTHHGQAAFDATIDDPIDGVQLVVLGGDPIGGFRVLAGLGFQVDLSGDGSDVRTVADIDLDYLSGAGDFHHRLVFADGTSGLFVEKVGGIFSDGFESGDTSRWSLTLP